MTVEEGGYPIVMRPEMVRAILEGRKVTTRRLVKPHWSQKHLRFKLDEGVPSKYYDGSPILKVPCHHKDDPKEVHWDRMERFHCPFGTVGHMMWVRETFIEFDPDVPVYKATPHVDTKYGSRRSICGPWKASIHLPRKWSRLDLQITDVYLQRINNLTPEEAYFEGILPPGPPVQWKDGKIVGAQRALTLKGYKAYWKKIHGMNKGFTFGTNPWVWVIGFKVERLRTFKGEDWESYVKHNLPDEVVE